jgi:ABC-type dipeptide/oligopeptide/nickel transport system permease component
MRGFFAWFIGQVAKMVLTLLGVSWITFALLSFAPGDPAEMILKEIKETPAAEQIDQLRKELGLEGGVMAQYLQWLNKALTGDLGHSWRTGEPVLRKIAEHFPATLELAGAALLFIIISSTLSGILSARFQGMCLDQTGRIGTIILLSIPTYALALLLIYFFALIFPWFPVMGRGTPAHLVLPVLSIGLSLGAMQGRLLRTTLLEIHSQEFIRFAYAKGLTYRRILCRHLLPHTLPPIITLWGISLGHLLSGSFIIETIFSWPGLGRLTVDAVLNRDVPLIQGTILSITLLFSCVNLFVDVLAVGLDPRARRHELEIKGLDFA